MTPTSLNSPRAQKYPLLRGYLLWLFANTDPKTPGPLSIAFAVSLVLAKWDIEATFALLQEIAKASPRDNLDADLRLTPANLQTFAEPLSVITNCFPKNADVTIGEVTACSTARDVVAMVAKHCS